MDYHKIYEKLHKYGITRTEIEAAGDCLLRENRKAATEREILVFLLDYIQWRQFIMARNRGDVRMDVRLTPQGRKSLMVGIAVDGIFAGKGVIKHGKKEGTEMV